jgi:hypothetical protein
MPGIVDWSFILTLGVIVLATLVGAYLRSAHKDRCLTDFNGYHVTVERKNNRVMWGDMSLQPTGFELVYRSDVVDEGHMETSYVYYKDEYDDIQAIYRYARDLTPELQKRRARSVAKSLHPGIARRARRSLRNFLSMAADSFSEALTLALGRMRRKGAALVTDTSQTYIRGIGKDVIGYVGTSFDPLLEKFVGTRVVVEVVEDDQVHEHVGMLKEYSADFLEVLDVYYPLPQEVKLSGQADHQIADKVVITLQEKQLRVHNLADQPQYLERIVVGEQTTELNAILAGGEEIALQMATDGQEIALHMRIASRLDMIVPRGHALIRHRAERYNPDTIFDVGLALVRRDSDEREIEQLRQALRYAPQDAISAAKLGEQLLQNGEYLEARYWLLEAQERCYRLPDRGNRVAQNLRQAERYLEQMRIQNRMAEELRIISLSSTDSETSEDVAVGI